MSTPWTCEGTVAGPVERTELDGEPAIAFWLKSGQEPHVEAARVFLPIAHADQVDEVSLAVGSALAVAGQLRSDGVTVATTLRPAMPRPEPTGRVIGTVEVRVPDLARLDPGRERRYQLTLWGGFAAIIGLGAVGMAWRSWVGNVGFFVFLAFCVWLLVNDLHTRRVDDREYGALARDAVGAVRSGMNVEVPEGAMFDMLGGGLDRTGNPWRPTRPRSPRRVFWVDEAARARLAADVTPQPLQRRSTATITVMAAPE
ncbi:hypothetical protein [Intrasporangium sp. YIM S08009]|uniref:hypothetical protein n=1 Tax=Intrasporangium zincisolvens TaxID=3080018 RepID=UPI002B051D93|nr:hypothetical protein [Intrasporangium sp. YIM S08009]